MQKNNWLGANAGDFDEFRAQVEQSVELDDWPHASAVDQKALVYDGDKVRKACVNSDSKRALMSEWVDVFNDGPGVIVIKQAFDDVKPIDQANTVFDNIIQQQKENDQVQGDHFATPGANDRIWNALEKHCVEDPQSFIAYYSNTCIAVVSEAWLGRGYQVTAQVNRVNPGGKAQSAHRDYHLGFMSPAEMERFPTHVHRLSPVLTLQGAIAHCDMPLESGPTLYLPFSQKFLEGYIAFTRREYQQYFNQHRAQLALEKGDAVFFNPALMHAAGENKTTDRFRLANLLQVSSAFGRAIETVDRQRMLNVLYPHLLKMKKHGSISEDLIENVIAASAEGYAFPTNLDNDSPVDGLAPQTQAELFAMALDAGATAERLGEVLNSREVRRASA